MDMQDKQNSAGIFENNQNLSATHVSLGRVLNRNSQGANSHKLGAGYFKFG
jgi:hypothetical protein